MMVERDWRYHGSTRGRIIERSTNGCRDEIKVRCGVLGLGLKNCRSITTAVTRPACGAALPRHGERSEAAENLSRGLM